MFRLGLVALPLKTLEWPCLLPTGCTLTQCVLRRIWIFWLRGLSGYLLCIGSNFSGQMPGICSVLQLRNCFPCYWAAGVLKALMLVLNACLLLLLLHRHWSPSPSNFDTVCLSAACWVGFFCISPFWRVHLHVVVLVHLKCSLSGWHCHRRQS